MLLTLNITKIHTSQKLDELLVKQKCNKVQQSEEQIHHHIWQEQPGHLRTLSSLVDLRADFHEHGEHP